MKKFFSLAFIVIMAVLIFVITNLLFAWLGAYTIIDATSEKLYTLSNDEKNLAKNLPVPVTLRFYVSDNLGSYDLNMGNYAHHVAGILNRYYAAAPDKIKLEIYRIKSGSESERQAIQDGILPIADDEQDFYFGLRINAKDKTAVIPTINPDRGQQFESDLKRILSDFSLPQKKVVGVMSGKLPLWQSSIKNPAPLMMSMLKQYYVLAKVEPNDSIISQDIDVLLVVYPVRLSAVAAYALDQYLMRGGKIIFIIDPYSEILHQLQGYPPHPDKEMKDYIQRWGIDYFYGKVAGNIFEAEKTEDAKGKKYAYPLWFFAPKDGQKLHFRTPGIVKPLDTNLNYQILADTGLGGGQIDVSAIRYAPKSEIIEAFEQDNENHILALAVKGQFYSHYHGNILEGTESSQNVQPYVPFSSANAEIVVIADSDFIADDSWVMSFNKDNPVYGTVSYADNISFLIKQIDRLSGIHIPSGNLSLFKKKNNIAEIFYLKSAQYYKNLKEQAEEKEALSSAYLKKLQRKKVSVEDVKHRTILDNAEKQNQLDKKNLQKVNRQIEAKANNLLFWLIILNLIIFPLLFLLLICFAAAYRRHLVKKKTEVIK